MFHYYEAYIQRASDAKIRLSFFRRIMVVYTTTLSLALVILSLDHKSFAAGPPPALSISSATQLQNALAEIDKGTTYSQLEVGYYAGHLPSSVPRQIGIDMLGKAADAEPEGTRKWFYLKALYAWGLIHGLSGAPISGVFEYADIFSYSDYARKAHATLILEHTINEYVFGVLGQLYRSGAASSPLVGSTLTAAWASYTSDVAPYGLQEPVAPWKVAGDAAGVTCSLASAIEKMAHDANYPTPDKDYLFTVLPILAKCQPKAALSALDKVKIKFGKEVYNDARFYQCEVTCDVALGDVDSAVSSAQQEVVTTRTGYDALLTIYDGQQKMDAIKSFVSAMASAHLPGREVLKAARVLAFTRNIGQMRDDERHQAQILLSAYLSSGNTVLDDRGHDEYELEARLVLAHILLARHEDAEAQSVLAPVAQMTMPPSGYARVYYGECIALLRR